MARPEKPIDWDLVDELIMAGCSGPEIAPNFNVTANTFYDKFKDYHKEGFQEYSSYRKENGKSKLKQKQFSKAIKGDNQMLLHLGKHMLGQKDTDQKDESPKQDDLDLKQKYYAAQYQVQLLQKELDDLKSKTNQELQRSNASI